MHEQQSWRLIKHVTVERGHRDPVGAERAQDGIDFAGDQHEIAGCRRSVSTSRLHVDRGRDTHRGRDFHTIERHRLGTRDTELIDAAVGLAVHAEHLCNLNRIEPERRRGAGCRWGGSGKREGVMHRGREGDRSSPPANVEIDEVR